MPRTPKPADSVKRSFDISRANDEWLYRLVDERKRSFAEVLNSEIEYVRTFGLPTQLVWSLAYAAESKGSSLRSTVQTLIMEMAFTLPKVTTPVSEPPPPSERKRSGANINGPNDLFVLRTANHEKVEWSAALNRLLDFARTYGLPPEPLARLEQAAKAKGVTARDLIAEALLRVALTLPPPPAPSTNPAATAAPRRRK